MRWSAEKLRWILLSGAVLLACVVAAIFGLANYRAGQIWRRILARNGVNLRRETNGFTYSQSDGKRTIFTLHAAKALPLGPNKWSLSDAVLVLYNKDGRTDRIYGSRFEYDQGAGVASAVGEVHMDLEASPSTEHGAHGGTPDLSFTPGDEAAADPKLIHVRTSGLTYVRKLGIAATGQPTEFRLGGLTCTSRGAEFDSGENIVRLLADVQLDGRLKGEPFTLTAGHAVLDRSLDVADLEAPTLLSGERKARAAHALLHLHADGTLEAGDADGGVEFHAGTQVLRAPRLHGDFGPANQVRHALFSGGVGFADSQLLRPEQGTARTLDLHFSDAGLLMTALGDGGVHLLTETRTADGAMAQRTLKAQTGLASFTPLGATSRQVILQTLHLRGEAVVTGQTPRQGTEAASDFTEVRGDDLLNGFGVGKARRAELQSIVGSGHTQLEQTRGDGQHQLSTGDQLALRFAGADSLSPPGSPASENPAKLQLVSATQTGHVVLRSWTAGKFAAGPLQQTPVEGKLTVGHADRALFTAASGALTLSGEGSEQADVYDGTTQISAPTIVLQQGTGDGEARGGVIATTGGEDGAPATHIFASRANLLHSADQTLFFGTDAQPARLWQSGSQVEAARLVLDGQQHTLRARPEGAGGAVHAIFANTHQAENPGGRPKAFATPSARSDKPRGAQITGTTMPEASRDALDVRAAAMDYNDLAHEATFSGKVSLRGVAGLLTGDHGAAFLEAVPHDAPMRATNADVGMGGRLQKFVLIGDVRLLQPGRTGRGEQLTYVAASQRFTLTGAPPNQPQIHDVQQGMVTGAVLLFSAGDSSIVVSGEPPATQAASADKEKPAKAPRVHTETDLKQP